MNQKAERAEFAGQLRAEHPRRGPSSGIAMEGGHAGTLLICDEGRLQLVQGGGDGCEPEGLIGEAGEPLAV